MFCSAVSVVYRPLFAAFLARVGAWHTCFGSLRCDLPSKLFREIDCFAIASLTALQAGPIAVSANRDGKMQALLLFRTKSRSLKFRDVVY